MKKRYVLHVTWSKKRQRWEIKRRGAGTMGYVGMHWRKFDVLRLARIIAKQHVPSQVVIHRRDGRIQTEHTYGDDPRRTKG